MLKLVLQSILYMFGLAPNPIEETPKKSDEENLRADWQHVGDSLRKAMNDYGRQTN